MSRAARKPSKDKSFPFSVIALMAISLAAGWVWLVATTHLHEMIVGALVVVLATLFLLLVQRSQPNTVQLRWKDVAQGWRIPWYLVCDIWIVSSIFFKDLLHLRPAGSYYRVCGFKCGKRDPAILARGVLATIYMTATPNTIVLGIDAETSRMLFHQLERTSIPKMAHALGARS
jgi:multisubunit Na+/H+ antiporter MnhE subunit